MKASEARIKYFNHYIDFEHLVRRLSRLISNYSTANVSLNNIIEAIASHDLINLKEDGINISILKKQKNVRN